MIPPITPQYIILRFILENYDYFWCIVFVFSGFESRIPHPSICSGMFTNHPSGINAYKRWMFNQMIVILSRSDKAGGAMVVKPLWRVHINWLLMPANEWN